ncbi:MAG: CHASE2 domain-containing protein [Cyanobacteria bacterium J06554_6]
MGTLVVLKIGEGDFERGFSAVLQLGPEEGAATVEARGRLPSMPNLPQHYRAWQAAYRELRLPNRLGTRPDAVKNVAWVADCRDRAQALCDRTLAWLAHADFQPLYSKLLEQLSPAETIRLVLQTDHPILRRLPWHCWDFFDRYPRAELALSAAAYEQVNAPRTRSRRVRVLAVFGDATGLDLKTDARLLQALPGIELTILPQPRRARLNQALWDRRGWDILFFAGHSHRLDDGDAAGQLGLNDQESLTLPELKYALRQAVKQGLAIALFNSCDGLGLAQDLADLHIPQVLVMREPVPDPVAHAFLKGFLESFAQGTPLYLAVRAAREQLQGLEKDFPCATWLPILCQNLAQLPPTWASLQGREMTRQKKALALGGSLALTALVLGVEALGGLQPLALAAYDRFLRWQPVHEPADERIVIIKNTAADIQTYGTDPRSGASISDATLQAVMEKLISLRPRVIGLDIYHDQPFDPALSALPQRLNHQPNLVTLCKHPAIQADDPGIAPAPGLEQGNRLGFSDFLQDPDGRTRRLMVAVDPPSQTRCPADYSFAVAIAAHYLGLADADWDKHLWDNPHDQFQLGQKLFPALRPRSGGYRLPLNMIGGYQMMIHYRHRPDPRAIAADEFSVSEFLSGSIEIARFQDRIVLIGTTDLSFGGGDVEDRDLWRTPYTTGQLPEDWTPGVYLQAHLISQLVSAVEDNRPLIRTWAEPLEAGWIGLGAAVGGLLGWWFSHRRFWLVLITAETGLLLICWGLLALPALWVPWVPTATTLAGAGIWISKVKGEQ